MTRRGSRCPAKVTARVKWTPFKLLKKVTQSMGPQSILLRGSSTTETPIKSRKMREKQLPMMLLTTQTSSRRWASLWEELQESEVLKMAGPFMELMPLAVLLGEPCLTNWVESGVEKI